MNCLSYDQIDALLNGMSPPEESMACLEHTAHCDACAQRLASRTVELPCAQPPAGLAAETLARARGRGRQDSLRSYSLRVLAAMAAALVLLFSGAFGFLANLPEELPDIGKGIATITEYFDFDFTKEGLPQ